MAKYGVLLISGKRTHQEGHAAAFAAHPDCEIAAVADENHITNYRADLNRQLADEYGVPYIDDLDEALARDDIHIVSMCADVERRGRVAARCAEAGKHLYLDKPLAGTVQDVDAIVEAVARSGVKSQMFSFVGAHWAQAAKHAIESGQIGDLKTVHAEVVFAKGTAGSVPEGTVRKEKESVERFTFIEAKREMFDIGVYTVGLVHWLTGRKTESVFGITGNYFFKEHADAGVEDFGTLSLTMEGGVTATIMSGRFGWMSHPKGGPQRIVVIGTKGALTFDAYRPRIEVYNDEPDFTSPKIYPFDPMGMWASAQRESGVMPKRRWVTFGDEGAVMPNDVAAFIECIEQDKEPVMSAKFAAPFTEVILAGYMSAATGKEIKLPLPR